VKHFIEVFNGRPWIDRDGSELERTCTIKLDSQKSSGNEKSNRFLTRRERREKEKKRAMERTFREAGVVAGELAPPPGIPQGFVGTKTKTLLQNAHTLPVGILTRLGLKERVSDKRFVWLYETHPLDDDEKHDFRRKDISHADDDAEEWDRHLSIEPRLDNGRLLGKVNEETLFESKVDNPWDKHGAEGLVFYTDAVKWDAKKGDFDERTTDGWDVSGRLLKKPHDASAYAPKVPQHERHFQDGHIPKNYKPTTVFDRKKSKIKASEEGIQGATSSSMGSFKLNDVS